MTAETIRNGDAF